MQLRLLLPLLGGAAVIASAASCSVKGSDGEVCLLGPCMPKITIPEFQYELVGTPNIVTDIYASTVTIRVGDSITAYFVRRRWMAPCGEPADTLRTGTWSITGPWGQYGDFSSVASITVMQDGRAILRATAPGHFAVRYVPATNREIPTGYTWQDVKFCPSATLSPGPGIYDFRVVP